MQHQNLDRRSLEMHCLVAEKIRRDPAILDQAADILARWRKKSSHSQPYFEEWQRLINAGLDACLKVATEDSERGNALRQCSPLACLLTQEERLAFLADWYGYKDQEAERWIERVRAAQASLAVG